MKLIELLDEKYKHFLKKRDLSLGGHVYRFGGDTYRYANMLDPQLLENILCRDCWIHDMSAEDTHLLMRYFRFCIYYTCKQNLIEDLIVYHMPKTVHKKHLHSIKHSATARYKLDDYTRMSFMTGYNVQDIRALLISNATHIYITAKTVYDHFIIGSELFEKMVFDSFGLALMKLIYDQNKNDKYNCLDVDINSGKITYIPKDKVSLINNYNYSKSKRRQVTTIGKIINYLDPKHEIISKIDVERISNMFSSISGNNLTLEVWEGDEIKTAYLDVNYSPQGKTASTLHNSCMRHKKCQSYMNFYKAAHAKIAVLLDKNRNISARALLWHIQDDIYFLDRIYSVSPFLTNVMLNKVRSEYKLEYYKIDSCFFDVKTNKPILELPKNYIIKSEDLIDYKGKVPYVDTFYYFDRYYGALYPKKVIYTLHNTNGFLN